MIVEQPMEGFGAARQFEKVALQRLRERIEQTPDVARLELFVTGFSPLVKHCGNLTIATHADIEGTDHQVMGGAVIKVGKLVVANAVILMMPAIHEFSDRALHETR